VKLTLYIQFRQQYARAKEGFSQIIKRV